MRPRAARSIVRWISAAMDRSYAAYLDNHEELSQSWAAVFRWRQRVGLKLAVVIDRDAALDQMANEGWWG